MNNRGRLKQLLLIFLFLSLLIFSALNTNYQIIVADYTNNTDNTDYTHALATAPKGLKWSDDTFTKADFSKANPKIKKANSMEIVSPTNKNKDNTSIIKMTNGTYQVGAAWGNKNNDNYFDIDHEQTVSMWLYFGVKSYYLKDKDGNPIKDDYGNEQLSTTPGDGMAFVIQNSDLGENAIAISADGSGNIRPVDGQSLGVWGADWDKSSKDSSKIASTAIQKSWALEFDTYVNNIVRENQISGEGVSFDKTLPGGKSTQHISANFPALTTTYIRQDVGRIHYFTMHHDPNSFNGVDNLVDSKWHHVTIKWTPAPQDSQIGNMAYYYNDKDPNTGKKLDDPIQAVNIPVDISNFKSDTSDTKELRWGFTGSTGKFMENNLLIFESIPSFVDAEATPKIYDDTNNGEEVTSKSSNINPNDDIRYTYSLNYKGWTKKWNNINATMEVPDHVHFTSGTITYPDSPTNRKPRQLPASIFKDKTAKELSYQLPERLDSSSRKAIIELKGKTDKIVTSPTTVNSAHASFEGDNLITDTDATKFNIQPRLLILESSSPNPIKINKNADVVIPAKVTYINGNDYSNLKVVQTLNGKTSYPNIKIQPDGTFKLTINHDNLKKISELSFYVTDNIKTNNSDRKISNTISRDIRIGGTVEFASLPSTASFSKVHSLSNSTNEPNIPNYQIIHRLGNWQVQVADTRSKGSAWTVQVNATDLVKDNNSKQKLNGHLFFKDINGNISTLANNIVSIANYKKDSNDEKTVDITQKWTPKTGILLSVDKFNNSGKYKGIIHWTLLDTPQNI